MPPKSSSKKQPTISSFTEDDDDEPPSLVAESGSDSDVPSLVDDDTDSDEGESNTNTKVMKPPPTTAKAPSSGSISEREKQNKKEEADRKASEDKRFAEIKAEVARRVAEEKAKKEADEKAKKEAKLKAIAEVKAREEAAKKAREDAIRRERELREKQLEAVRNGQAGKIQCWWKRTHGPWLGVLLALGQMNSGTCISWSSLKESLRTTIQSHSIVPDDSQALAFEENDEVSALGSTDAVERMVGFTAEDVTQEERKTEEDTEEDVLVDEDDIELFQLPESSVDSILLSIHVLDWIRRNKNNRARVNGFKNRIQDLALGSRTYCSSKRLVNSRSNVTIYEGKVTAGDRLLFTYWENVSHNDAEVIKKSLLIWYVSNHDQVSHYMDRINKSFDRKVLTDEEVLSGFRHNVDRTDLLPVDPSCNSMMRTFHVSATAEEINSIGEASWNPPLQLSKVEVKIVKEDRSILLLGRGGTGKTYCLCSRMHKDQVTLNNCKAIFVSHTERLKNNVEFIYKNISEAHDNVEIARNNELFKTTMTKLTDHLYRELRGRGYARVPIDFTVTRNRVTYARFNEEFYETLNVSIKKGMNCHMVWTQIYSFIKGSIEAAKKVTDPAQCRYLQRDEYVSDESIMSKGRCRLKTRDRDAAYTIFEKYQRWLTYNYLWDQMDFVLEVFAMLDNHRKSGNMPFYTRVYVDEIQDLTQAEIGVLLTMSSMDKNAYFFAGDTAQSITDGVDFRFEEVRSCYFALTQGNIFAKPDRLQTNFRSHDGIIQTANNVLHLLGLEFPDSFDKLDVQTGLATGPKPGVFSGAKESSILRLISGDPKLRILTWDHNVEKLRTELEDERRRILGDAEFQPLSVFGIKNVKGLEFENVAIVDFFCTLDKTTQKHWNYLVKRLVHKLKMLEEPKGKPEDYPLPEVEMQLKLLYTAITRARSVLYFIERQSSDAFRVWTSHLKDDRDPPLVESLLVEDVPSSEWLSMSVAKVLPDDIRSEAIELAEDASESDKEHMDACNLLIEALKKFLYVAHKSKEKDSLVSEQDLLYISKAKDQLKFLKLEEMLKRKYRDGSRAIKADIYLTPDGTDITRLKDIYEEINAHLRKADTYHPERIAAETIEICLSAGLISKALELSRSYCDRPHLKNEYTTSVRGEVKVYASLQKRLHNIFPAGEGLV